MVFARFFVTSVLALVMAFAFGSMSQRDPKAAQVALGNSELMEASLIEKELATKFGLVLSEESVETQDFGWIRFSLNERQALKGKLSEYLAHTMKVMALDSEKGIYISDKNKLVAKIDYALTVQKSADIFESRWGENFDPKKPAPLYKSAASNN